MTEPDEDLTLGDHLTPEERDIEAPEQDAVEQAMPASAADEPADDSVHRGLEVGEWDAAEQAHVVHLDDEYR